MVADNDATSIDSNTVVWRPPMTIKVYFHSDATHLYGSSTSSLPALCHDIVVERHMMVVITMSTTKVMDTSSLTCWIDPNLNPKLGLLKLLPLSSLLY